MDENKYINRHIENSIKKFKKIFKSILITGPRQAGKSTLLQHINKNMKYISFDNMVIRHQFQNDPMNFFSLYNMPIILDEIQREPEIFLQIKYEIDKNNKKAQLYMSGSQSFSLMKNVSESLAGRVGILNLLPLSIREKYNINLYDNFLPTKKYINKRLKLNFKLTINEIWENIINGGMPEIYINKNIDKNIYFSSYVTTYLERDVRELTQIGDLMKFYDVMIALASVATNVLNIENLISDLKINRKTFENYLSILEASHIIYILRPYYNNNLKRLIKSPKIYFLDTGLMAHLLGWKDKNNLMVGPMAGVFFENFVVSEIIKSYYNNGYNHLPIYFYRDKDKKEIDLLIEENGTLYPIEIKKHATIGIDDIKNFCVLQNINNIKINEGAVISTYENITKIKENVYNIPVWFL